MNVNLSYWEQQTWLSNIDFAIVGSGIVGLSCALRLREHYPKAKIVIFEAGTLPNGASTKNAGFACFGSVSEILDDLKTHSEEEVIALISKRYQGLQWLRKHVGSKTIDYQSNGGYEVFRKDDTFLYENCLENLEKVNRITKKAISSKNAPFLLKNDPFSFKNIQKKIIFNRFEGQLDAGKMILALIQKCIKKGVFIINSTKIEAFSEENSQVLLKTDHFGEIHTKKLFIATNGFAKTLLPDENIVPARAQVLITNPIPSLQIKGTFHLDKGYYYFRNIDKRILLGGGRNLDFEGETTTSMSTTKNIQQALETLLRTTILPNTPFEIAHRWCGDRKSVV